MILVDTSIWIDHLRSGNVTLARLLGNSAVLTHPWDTGELALGNLSRRDEVIGLLHGLLQATLAGGDEVLRIIEQEVLYVAGIGSCSRSGADGKWIDVAAPGPGLHERWHE